jgi:ferredoxin
MARQLLPKIDPDLCIACGLCAASCPYEVLEVKGPVAVVINPKACQVLRACEEVCPTAALTMEEQEVPE